MRSPTEQKQSQATLITWSHAGLASRIPPWEFSTIVHPIVVCNLCWERKCGWQNQLKKSPLVPKKC